MRWLGFPLPETAGFARDRHVPPQPTFVCQNCGAASARWQGKCEACGEWNTHGRGRRRHRRRRRPSAGRPRRARAAPFALEPLAGETHEAPRLPSGMPELDRVTGGGFVRGSVLLMAGDPGIGKSTLLIQAAAALARAGHRAVYISGEEAVAQVRLRAERLGLGEAHGRARRRDLGRGHHRDAVARARRRASSSSTRSRPCGPTRSSPRPAR